MKRRWSIPERWPYERMLAGAGTFVLGAGVIALFVWGHAPRWALVSAAGAMVVAAAYGAYASHLRHRRLRELVDCNWRRCLFCFFDLRGLPEHGACPECGERYMVREAREKWKDAVADDAEQERADSD